MTNTDIHSPAPSSMSIDEINDDIEQCSEHVDSVDIMTAIQTIGDACSVDLLALIDQVIESPRYRPDDGPEAAVLDLIFASQSNADRSLQMIKRMLMLDAELNDRIPS